MRYYLIFATSNHSYMTATIRIRGNKYSAIKEARNNFTGRQFIPVIVKRISKKMYEYICEINKTDGEV